MAVKPGWVHADDRDVLASSPPQQRVLGGPGARASILALLGYFAAQAALVIALQGGHARTLLAGVAVALGGAGVSVLALGWRRLGGRRWSEPAALTCLLAVAGYAVLSMIVTAQPWQSAFVLLAVVCAGLALSQPRWFAATLYLVWGGWVCAAAAFTSWAEQLTFATAMLAATAVSVLVFRARGRTVEQVEMIEDMVEAVTVRDVLTGLVNRSGLELLATPILESSRRLGDAVHALFVDVDDLARVNSLHGRTVGDEVLVSVAEALRAVTRATDVVARWEGDTFAVVGPGPGMAPMELERRIRERLAGEAAAWPGWVPGVSAGGTMLPPWDGGGVASLLAAGERELRLRRSLHRAPGFRSAEPGPG